GADVPAPVGDPELPEHAPRGLLRGAPTPAERRLARLHRMGALLRDVDDPPRRVLHDQLGRDPTQASVAAVRPAPFVRPGAVVLDLELGLDVRRGVVDALLLLLLAAREEAVGAVVSCERALHALDHALYALDHALDELAGLLDHALDEL